MASELSDIEYTPSAIKAGYWPSWSASNLPPSGIPSCFTHSFYAFVPVDPKTFKLSITPYHKIWMKNFTTTLDSTYKYAFLSIGGANSSADTFSKMAGNPDSRAKFIKSTIQVAREYRFEGLDIDWEFPKTPQDMLNLSLLFKEWYQAIKEDTYKHDRRMLLLSAAVYYAPTFTFLGPRRSYPIDAINQYLDFVCPMCYDFRGSWDTSVTGQHALLYDKKSNISASYGISAWISAGVSPKKLVMGLPLYGKTWKLKDPNRNGIGAPAVGVGLGGGGHGIVVYNKIVEFNETRGATEKYDEDTVSMYSYAGTDWIGYDGPQSIEKKIEFAKGKGLRGYFFWALGFDKDWKLSNTASLAWDK